MTKPTSLVSQLCISILALLLTACSFMEIKSSQVSDYDFSTAKTYAIAPNKQDFAKELNLDPKWVNSVFTNALQKEMEKLGFRRDDANPDIVATYFLTLKNVTDVYFVNNYYQSQHSYDAHYTLDNRKIKEAKYSKGTLLIDIIDANTSKRVWQGSAESRMGIETEKEKREKRAQLAVSKILSQLPK